MSTSNEFVTYKIALKLKHLGFDEPCFSYRNNSVDNEVFINIIPITNKDLAYSYISTLAPTWQSVFSWFRKEYQIIATFYLVGLGYDVFEIYSIGWGSKTEDMIQKIYDSVVMDELYDSEFNAKKYCLEKMIKIITDKNENTKV